MTKVRLRFAPSPTGEVHIGSIWLAHFDWLFARQHHGTLVLRLEDTDQKRLVPGAADRLYEALDWYGLVPDEGPRQGGAYGPYVQSERLKIYEQYARQLVEQGSAYYCFCSPQRLAELRATQEAAKLPPRYDKRCATISLKDARQRLGAGEAAVVRLNVPEHGSISFDDLVRGTITFRFDQLDDSVLLKSDGWPTYHLAVVVDDHVMEISHVLRAEEWLPSTPKHLLLYRAFQWTPPQFAHLPQILGPNKKKLSKREGAASALWFRDQGYLPEAMRNFLALMGWHPKGDEEVLSADQLLQQFTLEQINPSGAVFDQTKLDWLNGVYIRSLSLADLCQRLEPFWRRPPQAQPTEEWLKQLVGIIRDRLVKLSDINGLANVFFAEAWDEELALPTPATAAWPVAETQPDIQWGRSWLAAQPEPWSGQDLKQNMIEAIASAGKKNALVLAPLRQILSRRKASPDVFDILALLGKKESLRRIDQGLAEMSH